MIVLGVVLLVIVVVFAVAVVVSNPTVLNLYLFNALIPVTLGGVFFTGAGALLIVVIASLLIQRGIARAAKLRRQQRALAGAPSTAVADPPPTTPVPTTPRPVVDAVSIPPRPNGSDAVEPERPEPANVDARVTPPSAPVTTSTVDPTPELTPASSLDLNRLEPPAKATQPAALHDEAEESTRDEPLR